MANTTTTSNLKLTATDKVSSKLERISGKFKKLKTKTDAQTRSFSKMKMKVDLLGKSLKGLGGKTTSIGKNLITKMSVPIIAGFAGIIKVSADFEKAMNKVEAKSGATGATLEALRDQAKDLGATTKFSASQAADGMSFLAQAGWNSQQILKGMPALLSLAASSDMELGRAADITSNIMGAFNIKAEETNRVADVLAAVTAGANVDMEQLGDTMKKAAPIAATFGASLEGTAAAAGILGNVGIQGSDAGTAMKRAFLALSAPTSEASKMLNVMGIKTTDAQGNMLKFADIMAQLGGKLGSFPQSARLKVLNGLFGKIGIAGATKLQKAANSGELQKFSKRMLNVEGTAKRMADTMNKGAAGAMIRLQSSVHALALAIGESGLLESFTWLVKKLTEIASNMSKADKTTLKWGTAIAGLAIVLGPVISAFGALSSAFSFLIPIFTGLFSGLVAVVSFLGGPITLAVVAFAALAGIVYNKWEPIKKFFTDLWDSIGKGFSKAMGLIKKIPSFGSIFGGIGDILTGKNNSHSNATGGKNIAAPAKTIANRTNTNNSHVTVDFKNIPKGVKINENSSKSTGLNLNMGFQGASAI